MRRSPVLQRLLHQSRKGRRPGYEVVIRHAPGVRTSQSDASSDMDLARAPRRAARKKGSGYDNENLLINFPKMIHSPPQFAPLSREFYLSFVDFSFSIYVFFSLDSVTPSSESFVFDFFLCLFFERCLCFPLMNRKRKQVMGWEVISDLYTGYWIALSVLNCFP